MDIHFICGTFHSLFSEKIEVGFRNPFLIESVASHVGEFVMDKSTSAYR